MPTGDTYKEVITPPDESFLSKYFGWNREWIITANITKNPGEEASLQTSWLSDKSVEDLWQAARETGIATEEITGDDIIKISRGNGQTVMTELDDKNTLLYTEETGNVTYGHSVKYSDELKEFIRETHRADEEDVEYAIGRLDEISEEYLGNC